MAVLFMLVLGLQAPPATLAAGSPASAPDCHTAAAGHHPASHGCCTDTQSHSSCCPGAAVTAVNQTLSSGLEMRHGRPPQGALLHSTIFSSRGESPLIRPPIL